MFSNYGYRDFHWYLLREEVGVRLPAPFLCQSLTCGRHYRTESGDSVPFLLCQFPDFLGSAGLSSKAVVHFGVFTIGLGLPFPGDLAEDFADLLLLVLDADATFPSIAQNVLGGVNLQLESIEGKPRLSQVHIC